MSAIGPRLPPLAPEERGPEHEEALAIALRTPDGEPYNIFLTMGRHPKLMKRWLTFGGYLLARGVLPARDRELLILRTAWNCQANYEWGHHVTIATASGVDRAEIDRVPAGAGAEGWSDVDRTLLRAADELHGSARISDGTWEQLAARYDPPALVELLLVVGQYHLVSFFLNSTGVELEDGYEGLPSER